MERAKFIFLLHEGEDAPRLRAVALQRAEAKGRMRGWTRKIYASESILKKYSDFLTHQIYFQGGKAMKYLLAAVLMVLTLSGTAFADWQLYWNGKDITASFDLLSREPFRGKPSLWVRWQYVTPRNGIAGIKIQFTADCSGHRLYEISRVSYDPAGNYLKLKKNYDSPKQYGITPGSLNEATYQLMCR
jgi:hypothetical protein